jgi:hypothetical protein
MITLLLLALAGDVYVDNVKGDDATGAPFRTIAKAVAALKEGDTLHLARNDEPYRESVVLERGGIAIDGRGAVLTGLDPLDKALFAPHAPGIYKARFPALAKAQPRVVLDGRSMDVESALEEIEPGDHLWQRDTLYVALPEGKVWEKAVLHLRNRRDGVVVKGASKVVVRNLIAEQWEGDAFRVEGKAEGVRFENCLGRLAVGGESRGLHVKDGATVAAERCVFSLNGMGVHAIHRSRTSLISCRVTDNQNAGARVNGAEHAFEDCVFRSNGGADLMAVSLSPDSANGGGPSNVRATRCLFWDGKGPGLVVQLGEHGGEAVVRDSIFAKVTPVKHRGGAYAGDFNLFAGRFEAEEVELDFPGWRAAVKADAGSEARSEITDQGPWSVGGRDIGPRR